MARPVDIWMMTTVLQIKAYRERLQCPLAVWQDRPHFHFSSLQKRGLSGVDGEALGPTEAPELGTIPGSATH